MICIVGLDQHAQRLPLYQHAAFTVEFHYARQIFARRPPPREDLLDGVETMLGE
ncbi:hypothetical protein BJG93_36280 [Paraburkholderia sprentiae WSM5005]|uniref:Uncharacterized protein n=1 Tax=Paraburkholderia sprentiae WSM5005 TaxID=754502 RepID=A0A8F4KHL2_9BURK|nr:hypothetical protein BJG93_36280 [Paraburkholderia sprentiae WSM5005]